MDKSIKKSIHKHFIALVLLSMARYDLLNLCASRAISFLEEATVNLDGESRTKLFCLKFCKINCRFIIYRLGRIRIFRRLMQWVKELMTVRWFCAVVGKVNAV